jgi:hypothetical protein
LKEEEIMHLLVVQFQLGGEFGKGSEKKNKKK